MGRNFDAEFRPELARKEMLVLGVFCDERVTDREKGFPAKLAPEKLAPEGCGCSLNYYHVNAS